MLCCVKLDRGERMNDLISIIVPVYNAEKYIEHCLNSILSQTYTYFEVILINDGSKDASGVICEKYAGFDLRVKVVHQENMGVSKARQNGLEISKGKYIAFVDADDFLDEKFLEILYNDAESNNADIACCDCDVFDNNYDELSEVQFNNVVYRRLITSPEAYYHDVFVNKQKNGYKENYGCVVWGKLIKRELAITEKFDDLRYGEDMQYMFKLFSKSPITYLDPYKGYNYIRWQSGAMLGAGKYNVKRALDSIKVREFIYKNSCKLKNAAIEKQAEQEFVNAVYGALTTLIKNGDRAKYFENSEFLFKYVIKVRKMRTMPVKNKILIMLYILNRQICWMAGRVLFKTGLVK